MAYQRSMKYKENILLKWINYLMKGMKHHYGTAMDDKGC